jgi:hypothetical protein
MSLLRLPSAMSCRISRFRNVIWTSGPPVCARWSLGASDVSRRGLGGQATRYYIVHPLIQSPTVTVRDGCRRRSDIDVVPAKNVCH